MRYQSMASTRAGRRSAAPPGKLPCGILANTSKRAAALAALSHKLFYHGDSAEAEEMATAALTIAEPLQESRTIIEAFPPWSVGNRISTPTSPSPKAPR